jgi:hypothetical protein
MIALSCDRKCRTLMVMAIFGGADQGVVDVGIRNCRQV